MTKPIGEAEKMVKQLNSRINETAGKLKRAKALADRLPASGPVIANLENANEDLRRASEGVGNILEAIR